MTDQTPFTLSRRLSKLNDLIDSDYTHIWDCCCDHGQLGMALLNRNAAPHIHFVDVVPEIITKLEASLLQTYGEHREHRSKWHCHRLDASALPLNGESDRHLVILAGVGGDLVKEITNKLHQQTKHVSVDFLLCPIRQQHGLRSTLRAQGFRLIREVLVEDNNLIYEVLLVSAALNENTGIPLVSELGQQIWEPQSEAEIAIATRYLNVLLAHYQRRSKSNDPETNATLAQLQSIRLSINSLVSVNRH